MPLFEIKRLDGSVIVTQESDSLKGALELLVKAGANLGDANLGDANLGGAKFLRVPQLHTKILAVIEAGGKLEMSSWHTCETTHCRAGWAIHLLGNLGYYLESQYGSSVAGALITHASCPWMEKTPDFHCDNETALADIRACAERERVEAAKEAQ